MATQVRDKINLKGSVDTVVEFFQYAVNSILYQRGIYASESFESVKKYELSILITKNKKLQEYLKSICTHLSTMMMKKVIRQIDVVIVRVDTGETIEKWEFAIQAQKNVADEESVEVDMKVVRSSIRDIIRQITATVTYLPLIDFPVSFDILIHTPNDTEISDDWGDSVAHHIAKAEKVQLKSFSTNIHNVQTNVCYKIIDD